MFHYIIEAAIVLALAYLWRSTKASSSAAVPTLDATDIARHEVDNHVQEYHTK
jgi:hypothetical protein